MDKEPSSFFAVAIDFDKSHMFFPTIIMYVLLMLLLLIILLYGIPFIRSVLKGKKKIAFSAEQFDKLRFFGTILLTIGYFLSMEYVGRLFPNMGYGFLLMSMPFMLLLSLLYVHNLNLKKFIVIGVNALAAPSIAWYVLANMFNITLP